MLKEELIAFEEDIAREFEAGHIHAPIHLSGGNEDQLIEIFKDVKPEDWVLSTWRSHYHALLKGIPKEEVKRQIMEGRSMYISSVKHKFLSSAIVGGTLPIACGLAYGGEKVWCFIGDMAASIGTCFDAVNFISGHDLSVNIVVEDNGLATNTPTGKSWGDKCRTGFIRRYSYKRTYPHTGVGKFVQF